MMHKLAAALAAVVSLLALSTTAVDAHQKVDKRILKMIKDLPGTAIKDKGARIRKGRDIFLNKTFGNGRTCGTCHEPTRSFAIDPEFIATLPQSSPLFVAENNPALRNLENPDLMRRFGLILENLDGFDQPGVMRGVPHTLALPTSITPQDGFPLVNATGWSGDGAPGDGSLRNFIVGAIVQHMTKNLLRRPNIDFTLPTKQEMDAVLDFQLSLGRRADINLAAMTFNDPLAENGKALFFSAPTRNNTTRSCNGCHGNAGANDANGKNRMFDTGTRFVSTAPVCRGNAPGDGGFLSTPIDSAARGGICANEPSRIPVVFRGNGQFNTPPLIEAADTPPFFHNNSAPKVEHAVAHYNTDRFNQSPAGGNNAFALEDIQIFEIAAMLRALNARENVLNSLRVDQRALKEGNKLQTDSIRESMSEVNDAVRVIREAQVPLYIDTPIVSLLLEAAAFEQAALETNGNHRRTNLAAAMNKKNQALPMFTK